MAALELFLGHSQLEVTVGVEIGEKGKEKRAKEEKPPASETRADLFSPSSSSLSGSTSSSSIMRRADIHISHAQPKVERGVIVPPSNPGTLTDNTNNDSETKRKTTNQNASPPSTTTVTAPTTAMFQQQSLSGTPVDINGDDYYVGSTLSRSLEFLPQEMRQEYPSVILPLELEHTLGLYQKVYLLTPYTLEWRIPDRVLELLEYSESRLRLIKRSQSQVLEPDQVRLVRETLRRNTKTYLAKLSIELVNHDTLETVSVLAKNVPAETRFQYLQILDRVELDQYRLRVQMVVVELEDHHVAGGQEEDNDETGLHSAASRIRSTHGDHTEGWDFPPGGKVVDRYESITRRFWLCAFKIVHLEVTVHE
ncbi:hypothetical protein BGZ83_006868 [Gryganskiella cystojenkinii]|nr:hypothetical protein BGZ83_006868 [Gryganskiella cystojenkinii]